MRIISFGLTCLLLNIEIRTHYTRINKQKSLNFHKKIMEVQKLYYTELYFKKVIKQFCKRE